MVVMARAPDGSDMFQSVRFHSPSAGAGREASSCGTSPSPSTTTYRASSPGSQRPAGTPEIFDFQNTFLLCYVRGPGGLIVELAERLDARAPLTATSGRRPRFNSGVDSTH